MFCCSKVIVGFTHILQDYFTCTGAYDCHSASEAILLNMVDKSHEAYLSFH